MCVTHTKGNIVYFLRVGMMVTSPFGMIMSLGGIDLNPVCKGVVIP